MTPCSYLSPATGRSAGPGCAPSSTSPACRWPDAETARAVTGHERGTITPFGALHPWPVIADARVQGTISIGAGAHGVSALADAADVIEALSATVADVTAPQACTGP